MNKKLITLAVAAAMTAPAAALADATLYGKLNVSIDYFDVKDGFNGWTLDRGQVGQGSPRANRVGVKGSEDLGGGLNAIYQVEFGVPLANEEDYNINNGDKGNAITMRNSFVGLAGNFGTFLVGRHDTPMKISTAKLDMFTDTMADYNGTVGFNDVRADNAIAYVSPSFSGFQFMGAAVPGSASTAGLGYWGNQLEDVLTYGLGTNVTIDDGVENIESESIAEGWSLAGIYSNGPFYGALAYESLSNELVNFNITGDFDGNPATEDTTILLDPDSDFNKWRVGLGLLDWNGFSLTGIYENHDIGDLNADLWQLQGGYAFGNNTIKAMYGERSIDLNIPGSDNVDSSTWAIGVDHNFSKRTRAYAVYTDYDQDGSDIGDWNGFSLGMVHKF